MLLFVSLYFFIFIFEFPFFLFIFVFSTPSSIVVYTTSKRVDFLMWRVGGVAPINREMKRDVPFFSPSPSHIRLALLCYIHVNLFLSFLMLYSNELGMSLSSLSQTTLSVFFGRHRNFRERCQTITSYFSFFILSILNIPFILFACARHLWDLFFPLSLVTSLFSYSSSSTTTSWFNSSYFFLFLFFTFMFHLIGNTKLWRRQDKTQEESEKSDLERKMFDFLCAGGRVRWCSSCSPKEKRNIAGRTAVTLLLNKPVGQQSEWAIESAKFCRKSEKKINRSLSLFILSGRIFKK